MTIAALRFIVVFSFGEIPQRKRCTGTGATVSVIGYDSEAQVTKASGNFSLPAHATDGQQVQLHAEKAGYHAANSWCPAGDTPCTILLQHD